MAERVGCGTPSLLGSLCVREVVGSRPDRGKSKEVHPTRKLVKFSLLKLPSIPYSEIRSACKCMRSVSYTSASLPRHPATLITTPIPANYYKFTHSNNTNPQVNGG